MTDRLYYSQRNLLALRVMQELNVHEGRDTIAQIIAALDRLGVIDIEKARDIAQALRNEGVRPL